MTKRLKRFSDDWNRLARCNPYGAILTGLTGELPEWSVEQFFETGKADAARFMADLERIAPAVPRGRLLDFGCGVGRVTRALADYYESVVGMDVAPTMIAQARLLNRSCTHCAFVVNRPRHLGQVRSGTFDVVYSRLVL